MPQRAEMVVVGNEVLTGKIRDENGPFLAAELRALGVVLRRIVVVPDELDEIATAVRAAAERVDFVVTSGGVGPTLDDLTFEGVAQAFGRPLRRFPEMERVLRTFFGATVTDTHLVMADLPDEAELVFHEGLVFPVVKVRNVYVMPGSPAIFRKKWRGLRERFRAAPFVLRKAYVRLEEGLLSPHLDRLHEAEPGVEIGSYPVFDAPDYDVLVTLESTDSATADRALARLLAGLDPAFVARTE
jgi:molybdenum cofactor synthesis domain-containing protein